MPEREETPAENEARARELCAQLQADLQRDLLERQRAAWAGEGLEGLEGLEGDRWSAATTRWEAPPHPPTPADWRAELEEFRRMVAAWGLPPESFADIRAHEMLPRTMRVRRVAEDAWERFQASVAWHIVPGAVDLEEEVEEPACIVSEPQPMPGTLLADFYLYRRPTILCHPDTYEELMRAMRKEQGHPGTPGDDDAGA